MILMVYDLCSCLDKDFLGCLGIYIVIAPACLLVVSNKPSNN